MGNLSQPLRFPRGGDRILKKKKIGYLKIFRLWRCLAGEMFVAREKNSQFVVALKWIVQQIIENGNFLKHIKRMTIIQSTLNSLNILKLYEYFADPSFL